MTKTGAILLAAGLSRRMPGVDKLLHSYKGKPLLLYSLETLARLELAQITIVAGRNQASITPLAEAFNFSVTINPIASEGMGTSIAIGASTLANTIEQAFVCLGDMPLIQPRTYHKLEAELLTNPNFEATAPVYAGERGHPVLFRQTLFQDLTSLTGDRGAKDILAKLGEHFGLIDTDDPGCIHDYDTFADFDHPVPR